MSMRGLGLVARFVLMVYVARTLGLQAVGLFGLIYAGVAIAPSLLNMGIHYRLNRLMVGAPVYTVGRWLRDRAFMHLAFFVPLALLGISILSQFQYLDQLEGWVVGVVVSICIADVLLNEINLALVAIARPILSNSVFFFRSAFWIFPFVGLSGLYPHLQSLDMLLSFWLGGQIFAFIVFFVALRDWPWARIFCSRTDFAFIFLDFGKSLMVCLSDLGAATGQFVDRFILGVFLDFESLGVYVFFWSLAIGVYQLVYTAVVQIAFPRLVDLARDSDRSAFRCLLVSEMRNVFLAASILAAIMFSSRDIIYMFAKRPELMAHDWLFAELLVGIVIKLVSDVAAYGLYACGHDRMLVAVNIMTPLFSVLFIVGVMQLGHFDLIGMAFVFTCLLVCVVRVYGLKSELIYS